MAVRRTRRSVSSPAVDHDSRWRPRSRRKVPACGYVFDGKVCLKSGPHHCEPRADRVVGFFAAVLVHTKGTWARRAFTLEPWQEHDIIRPVFGEVVWTDEYGGRYVRRYRIVYIVLGRKNGKTELAAGIVHYLLVGDDEEAAEVYGAAKDTHQAGKVAEVVERMRQLSPVLSGRLRFNKNSRRVSDERTGSYYEVITADAEGELGHNPHGFVLDEVLSQANGDLWDAMRTAMGARAQPLMVLLTTETNDPNSFGADMIDEAERIQADPARAPHAFAYVRKTPQDADVFDEANWRHANPALGSFLSIEALRIDAQEAKNEPQKENAFRQFRCNQRVNQLTRYMPLHLWDAATSEIWPTPEWGIDRLLGRRCFAGLDLAAKIDLTAWCLWFPEEQAALWRFWLPEATVPWLDKHTDGKVSVWVKEGWIKATEGDVVDYEVVYADIGADHERFAIADVSYDEWSGEPVRQRVEDDTGLELVPVKQTYAGLTDGMTEVMALVTGRSFNHFGNPVARWCADSVEAKSPADNPDLVRPVKPSRNKSGKRVDGFVTAVMAVGGAKARGGAQRDPATLPAAVGEGSIFRPSGRLDL